jgi:hypothetical protein
MAAAAPRTTLLFADSFRHERLCQHVDEVNFQSRHFFLQQLFCDAW